MQSNIQSQLSMLWIQFAQVRILNLQLGKNTLENVLLF